MNENPIMVGIARGVIVQKPGRLITYALGSCVGVCLYDKRTGLTGMAHILLPSYRDAVDQSNLYKFADTGCEKLYRSMLKAGADRHSVTAKIVGGARMFRTDGKTEGIGERNVKSVKGALGSLGILLVAEDTGKDYGRTVILDSESGRVTVTSLKYGVNVI